MPVTINLPEYCCLLPDVAKPQLNLTVALLSAFSLWPKGSCCDRGIATDTLGPAAWHRCARFSAESMGSGPGRPLAGRVYRLIAGLPSKGTINTHTPTSNAPED